MASLMTRASRGRRSAPRRSGVTRPRLEQLEDRIGTGPLLKLQASMPLKTPHPASGFSEVWGALMMPFFEPGPAVPLDGRLCYRDSAGERE
jgi:hypothetical protein